MFICCFDAAKISIFFNKLRDKKGKMSVKTGKKPIFPIWLKYNAEKGLSRLSRCHAMPPDAWVFPSAFC